MGRDGNLVQRLKIDDKIASVRNAGDCIGKVLPEIATDAGLPAKRMYFAASTILTHHLSRICFATMRLSVLSPLALG